MNCRTARLLGLLALLSTLGICACSDDDPSVPITNPGLEGWVVDAEGNALEGIAIGLIYDIPGAIQDLQSNLVIVPPLAKPRTEIRFDLPEAEHVHLWITDYAGDFVITLLDEESPSGTRSEMWDGLNEAGVPVPSGMYYAHIQVAEEEATTFEMFLLFLEADDFLTTPNATTNATGRFHVPDSLIPVGEILTSINESGNATTDATVTNQVRLLAVHEISGVVQWTETTVTYVPGASNGGFKLVMP